jgi:hypothetical protein
MDRRKPDRRTPNQDQLLSDKQVALMAGVPVNTVSYWRLAGMLPFVKLGRHPRVWLSVFQKTFHQPKTNGPWEPLDEGVKIQIQSARGIGRKHGKT